MRASENKNIFMFLKNFFQGLVVGGTMLVPGVSGGSMAMILGIYDKLISSISSFFKHIKESIFILVTFGAGAALGMILFAKPLLHLIETYQKPMLFFFIGAVIGGIPLIYNMAKVKKISFRHVLYVVIGVAIVMLFQLFPTDTFSDTRSSLGIGILVVAGIIAAIALVLPGISVSYMLFLLGLYNTLIEAIGDMQLMVIVPFGVGLILGTILTTKLLETAMNQYPEPTYLIIMGFIIGSVVEIFPGIPLGVEVVVSFFTFIAGYGFIRFLSKMEG